MQIITKIFYIFCIIFSVITAHCSDIPENNVSEYKAKHLHYLEERRKRLENEKENEKKENETWSNTFCMGTRQIGDQVLKLLGATAVGFLVGYPFKTQQNQCIMGGAAFLTSIVTLNWKFYSPVQKHIIRKELREMQLEEVFKEIEEIKST